MGSLHLLNLIRRFAAGRVRLYRHPRPRQVGRYSNTAISRFLPSVRIIAWHDLGHWDESRTRDHKETGGSALLLDVVSGTLRRRVRFTFVGGVLGWEGALRPQSIPFAVQPSGSHGQGGLRFVAGSSHPAAFHRRAHHAFAGGFHRAGADAQSPDGVQEEFLERASGVDRLGAWDDLHGSRSRGRLITC